MVDESGLETAQDSEGMVAARRCFCVWLELWNRALGLCSVAVDSPWVCAVSRCLRSGTQFQLSIAVHRRNLKAPTWIPMLFSYILHPACVLDQTHYGTQVSRRVFPLVRALASHSCTIHCQVGPRLATAGPVGAPQIISVFRPVGRITQANLNALKKMHFTKHFVLNFLHFPKSKHSHLISRAPTFVRVTEVQ